MEVKQRWLLRQFDGFLTVGQRNREYLEHFGVSADKIFFAPHFVDNEWFAAKAERGMRSAELRQQWGADERTFVALFAGKFIAKKRPLDLLRAVATFNRQPSTANVLPVFVGAGELEAELREFATREKLRAHFAGFKNQSELPAVYAAADALVLPSDGGETWGLVVNEALACGTPVIVSDAVGCAPDLIEAGATGFTFPLGEATALAARLQQMVVLRASGHSFAPALAAKLQTYSLERAVAGTLAAGQTLAVTPR
jgi:glycosyltransferase involved in cell wall biosynthesis